MIARQNRRLSHTRATADRPCSAFDLARLSVREERGGEIAVAGVGQESHDGLARVLIPLCKLQGGKERGARGDAHQPALLFAYSSDSSVATLPYTMKSTERMHVKKDIGNFILSLGATLNMDGVAIYLCVTTVFIAACCGIHLTMGMYLGIAFTATIASIGTPGIPGGSLAFMSMIFALVGIPIEYVAVIAGVDRFVDMARTVMSVVGDASCAVIMQHQFGDKTPNLETEINS